MIWTYIGDALWVAALTIMFGASRQAAGRIEGEKVELVGVEVPRRLVLWALPAAAFLLSLGLAFEARLQDVDADAALILFGVRAVTASLVALAHLRVLREALEP
jgi:hypothetical protein